MRCQAVERKRSIMKRSIAKLTMSGPNGGGGASLDDVLKMIYGSSYSGASTDDGVGVRYSQSQTSTEHT